MRVGNEAGSLCLCVPPCFVSRYRRCAKDICKFANDQYVAMHLDLGVLLLVEKGPALGLRSAARVSTPLSLFPLLHNR